MSSLAPPTSPTVMRTGEVRASAASRSTRRGMVALNSSVCLHTWKAGRGSLQKGSCAVHYHTRNSSNSSQDLLYSLCMLHETAAELPRIARGSTPPNRCNFSHLSGRICPMMDLTCGSKPMSNMRSASSNTCTPQWSLHSAAIIMSHPPFVAQSRAPCMLCACTRN